MLYNLAAFFAQERVDQRAQAASEAAAEAPTPPPELLFHIGPVAITNTIVTAWLVIIVLVLFAWLATRNMRQQPQGVQNFWELIIELWVGVSTRTMGERRGRRFLPLVATAFLMIVLAEFFELRSLGGFGYLKGLLIPNPMRWLEIFTRPLSLSFRLFGNIFAGEVLLATMIAVAPYVLFVFIGLELFVGLIQALIFSMLSLVFLSIATVHEDAHEPHGAHDSIESELAAASHGQPF